MSRKLFIVIEGVDGSGKSTAVQKVSKKLGAAQLESPIGIFRKLRHLVENAHPTIRFLYYALANHWSCLTIRHILSQQMIVCGRFIHSTKAHHIIYGCPLSRIIPLTWLSSTLPDLVYYLSVRQDVRLKRINQRSENNPKDYDSESLEKVHLTFLQLPNLIVIDTTNLSEEEVAEFIYCDISNKINSSC